MSLQTLRSQNSKGLGGCILSGTPIESHGNVQNARTYFDVNASKAVLGDTRTLHGFIQLDTFYATLGLLDDYLSI